MSEQLATLSFQPEAYESAFQFFLCICAGGPHVWGVKQGSPREPGYAVHVVTKDGREFDAEAVDVIADQDTGQYKLVVAPWDEDTARGDRSKAEALDLYDELERVEVY